MVKIWAGLTLVLATFCCAKVTKVEGSENAVVVDALSAGDWALTEDCMFRIAPLMNCWGTVLAT